MNSIYIEAILFVAAFGGMSIISIIISKRHAKNYLSTKEQTSQETPIDPAQKRIEELLKLANTGILTHKEFQILKEAKNHSQLSTSSH
ncbi:MAG: hypothetical protein U9R50_01515 [Campylobacterota bacterium]|nr:hypothetical protein [Campylobacterota bacterium]